MHSNYYIPLKLHFQRVTIDRYSKVFIFPFTNKHCKMHPNETLILSDITLTTIAYNSQIINHICIQLCNGIVPLQTLICVNFCYQKKTLWAFNHSISSTREVPFLCYTLVVASHCVWMSNWHRGGYHCTLINKNGLGANQRNIEQALISIVQGTQAPKSRVHRLT